MKRWMGLLCSLILLASLSGCGIAQYHSEDENCLHLYYPTVLALSQGGDAIDSVDIAWESLPQDDRQEQAEAVLALLMGGCEKDDFTSPVPAGTSLLKCTITGRTVWVDFSASYGQLSGMDLTMADYCVALSLTQIPGIYAVRITVAGQELAYRDTNLFLAGDVLLTSTEDVVRTLAAQLYFLGEENVLVPEDRLLTLYEGESRVGVVVNALLSGPETEILRPLLPEGFAVLSVRLDEGVCYLNLPSENLALMPETAMEQRQILWGMVRSLCSVEDVDAVQILIDGEYRDSFGKLDISELWKA